MVSHQRSRKSELGSRIFILVILPGYSDTIVLKLNSCIVLIGPNANLNTLTFLLVMDRATQYCCDGLILLAMFQVKNKKRKMNRKKKRKVCVHWIRCRGSASHSVGRSVIGKRKFSLREGVSTGVYFHPDSKESQLNSMNRTTELVPPKATRSASCAITWTRNGLGAIRRLL